MLTPARKHVLGGPVPEKKPRANRTHEEAKEQRLTVKWLRSQPDWMVLRLENAQRRTEAQLMRDIAMGMEPGAPDLVLLYKRRVVFCEMKKAKGGTVSESQHAIHHQLRLRGQFVVLCHGFEHAKRELANLAEWIDLHPHDDPTNLQ